MKRKEKEQLATGMDEIGEALSAVAKMAGASEESNTIQSPTLVSSTTQTSRTKLGQIGEGKGVTLTESQRRRAL